MKTELTTENKVKFFVQYWGQEIQSYKLTYSWKRNQSVSGYSGGFLSLKNLCQLSDDEALELSTFNQDIDINTHKFVFNNNESAIRYVRNNIYFLIHKTQTADYLRRKGYAIRWMNISVDDQIEAGWIKLLSQP